MYRDEESVAQEHAADLQGELEALLAPRLAVARRWRPRFWHWVVALGSWIVVVFPGTSEGPLWAQASWLGSWIDYPDRFWAASALTTLVTGGFVASFFGAMALAGRLRASKILRRFGPPPATLRASDRIPLLKRRLADLRFQLQGDERRDPIAPDEERP